MPKICRFFSDSFEQWKDSCAIHKELFKVGVQGGFRNKILISRREMRLRKSTSYH